MTLATCKSQNYLVYTRYLTQRPNLWHISLYGQPISRYKVVEKGNTEWYQNDLKRLTVKNTPYTLSTYPPRLKFRSVLLYGQPFSRDKLPWTLNYQKNPVYTRYWTQRPTTFGSMSSRLLDTTDLKHDSQTYPVYTKYSPQRPNFGPFRSTTSHFQDIAHFIISPWLPC